MTGLTFNEDNTKLSCDCGAVTVGYAAWSSMTEWSQTKVRTRASECPECDKLAGPSVSYEKMRAAIIADWVSSARNDPEFLAAIVAERVSLMSVADVLKSYNDAKDEDLP